MAPPPGGRWAIRWVIPLGAGWRDSHWVGWREPIRGRGGGSGSAARSWAGQAPPLQVSPVPDRTPLSGQPARGAPHGPGPPRGHPRDGHLDRRGPEVHRVPPPQRVRAADPRRGAAGTQRQAGHADDGRPADHGLDGRSVPHLLRPHARGADGLLRHPRLRRDRLHRRLDEAHATPLARPRRPLEARPARAHHGLRRARRLRAGLRDEHLPAARRRRLRPLLGLVRAPLPDDRRRRQRREPHRRPRRARGRAR